ncbi:MAG: cell wall metabolism sensor histidine kinase WalK [Candidatus Cloacimonetes bacterium]|nr:cell wall metabolism sensor histidine kinase WalK [Candidatus Cloacimonadota bacterium]
MKLLFTKKIRLLLSIIFVITLLQSGIILHLLNNPNSYFQMKLDIINTIYVGIFVQLIIVLFIIFYIPIYLHKAFSEINNIIKDVSNGVYNIDVDLSSYKTSFDKEFFAVINLLVDMSKAILTFDNLKKDKIVEQHNRIVSILNLTEDGFLIFDIKGNFVYINDNVTNTFATFEDKSNILEDKFPPEIENNVKKYAQNLLSSKTKQEPQQFFVPSMKRHIVLNSALIRDPAGKPTGAIISMNNLTKIKRNKEDEEDQS